MLSSKRLDQIREFLKKTQNPLFLFDNDVDGLTSFLLLRRFCKKGKGIAIKSFPGLNNIYVRKLHELNPDYIFVLDKAIIEKSFRDPARELGIPIIWIDHHEIPDYAEEENIFYFNPKLDEAESKEPTAYLCYNVTKRKEDEWIAMLGCLADWNVPDFAEDFSRENPDLFIFTKDPAKALYETTLGNIVKMLSFALKDRTSIVVRMLKNLLTIKDPRELLDITPKTVSIYTRYNQINRKYEKILKKAKEIGRQPGKLLFFQYSGELSLSSDLSNELSYLYPEKIIVVCYIKGPKVNVSFRGDLDVREIASKAFEGIEGNFGGHKKACGASLSINDLPKFWNKLKEITKS